MNLKFQFKEDSGSMETALVFDGYGNAVKPDLGKTWADYKNQKILVPDILDYNNKIIIEYDETWKKQGKKTLKGHDPDGLDTRTFDRDFYYSHAKFRVLKVFDYETDDVWKRKVFKFLINCQQIEHKAP